MRITSTTLGRQFCVFAGALVFGASGAFGATVTDTFTSQIIITASCSITSTNDLDFGSQGVLGSNIDATTTFGVQCTNSTTYNVGLDGGTGLSGDVTTRTMENGGASVNYTMWSDSGRSTNWGNTVGVDTVSDTGDGAVQTKTIYGRVPAQTTPAAATYTDTITITVTY